jgi:hypothetical protein
MGRTDKDKKKKDTIKPRKPKPKGCKRREVKGILKDWESSDWEDLGNDELNLKGDNNGSRNDRE